MSEIIFSCECGMTIKVKGDGTTGGRVDCPSCATSVLVPSFQIAAIISPGVPPEFDEEPEPRSAARENLTIIYVTLVSLATIGTIAFFLIPALRGPKDPASVLASESSRADPAEAEPWAATRSGDPTGTVAEVAPDPLPNYAMEPPAASPSVPTTKSPAPSRPRAAADRKAENVPPRAKAELPTKKFEFPKASRKPIEKAKPKPAEPSNSAALKLAEALRLEDEGKKKQALTAFEALAAEFPDTIEASHAKNHIRKLKKALEPVMPQSTPPHGGITPRG